MLARRTVARAVLVFRLDTLLAGALASIADDVGSTSRRCASPSEELRGVIEDNLQVAADGSA